MQPTNFNPLWLSIMQLNLIALVTYLTVMGITPGPNNLVLAASGINHGFNRTVPMLLGMAIGLGLQVGILTCFLGSLVAWMESLKLVLAVAGCAYLLWLAFKMANAGQPGEEGEARAMGFVGGLLFNWLNPKVWLMGFNVVMVFLPEHMAVWQAALLFTMLAIVVTLPCIAIWAWGGVAIKRFLDSPRRLSLFNHSMAGMLALTAIWLLVEMLPAGLSVQALSL